ncbi:cupin domain-containing protein [Pseudobacteriovorax antillogorgiicola]|uniref:Mannose-6-phosphate isomerase, cupin superfamily n=1 Tax=Pseudobacteriovorax antillogorgiicola TaxID=1513793 RepID=A0A1Y6CD75_9BACT|nr:cupin domain-containing protein [Pseudobacteriovorax antillogorgiicola]TCS47897.1 mannose-6-phosphate isomerase-like protein (cupin superfamily) [Pseudobacteriovorax antillogorgiicola]SMF57733.1 Mannose-6-phosphate isomerase, cupin superfamily [Pseudobacteriovorax antillogorgiicola]
MNNKKVNLLDKFELLGENWSPRVVAELNQYQFKIAWFEGEFVWHSHNDTDEAFLVLEGHIKIHLESQIVDLREGELFVVPKGISHKPEAIIRSKLLLLEPKGVINTGEAQSDLRADNDVWI